MTEKTIHLLSHPHPQSHIVFPYGVEDHLVEAVTLYTASGLSNDDAVVLVTTPDHWRLVEQRLATEGFDLDGLQREGRVAVFDANGLLCRFFQGDAVDDATFKAVVGEMIATARSHSPSGRVRVYGEMVNVLCGHNNVDAAAVVEELWNEVLELNCVPLLCSYSLQMLPPHTSGTLPRRILDAHSHTANAA
jgi:hypothetical protein